MLRVKKNDRVRIHSQGITAEGPVLSAYDCEINGHTRDNPIRQLIGYEPEGIEMRDENRPRLLHGLPTGKMGAYRYWKRGDGGHVFLLKDNGEWAQVFPHQTGGWTRYDE